MSCRNVCVSNKQTLFGVLFANYEIWKCFKVALEVAEVMQEQDLNLVKRSVSGLLSNVSKYENIL